MREESAESARIEQELRDDVVVLHMSGQMRETGAEALRAELDRLVEEGHYRLIFDLSNISFISSVGLGQMMRAFRATTSNGGYVRIVNPQPLVEEVFRFTKLHTLIGIFPTVEDAIAAE
ncbi:MAG: STAS domain-containing protein [Candidatus Brocadiaceae bacterium]|nr:STAS domain-containing protein [Candidatus Brocadiaceae bacterium]